MRISALVIARELNSITPLRLTVGFSGRDELRANAFVPSVAAHVYRLHFGRFATRVLKVVQYQHLT